MKLLLDTHIFLWYISGDHRLHSDIRDAIRNLENQVFLSAISLWEVIIKFQLGKFSLPSSPEIYLPEQRRRHEIDNLDIDESSVSRLSGLPQIHRDPFDRMLICQALEYDLILVTADRQIGKYPVQILKHRQF